MSPRVKARPGLLSALSVLLGTLAVAGCGGTLAGAELESKIEQDLSSKQKGQEVQVRCPKEIKLQAMATFDCPATVGQDKGVVRVVQQDDKGNVRYQYREQAP